MGEIILGKYYNDELDYVMVMDKGIEYCYKKYFYINKNTKKSVLFFVDIIGINPEQSSYSSSIPVFLNKEKKLYIPMIDKPNMVPQYYKEIVLKILDFNTLYYMNSEDDKIQNIYANCPLILNDNNFRINPEFINSEDIFITPTMSLDENISKFVSSTIGALQEKMLPLTTDYKCKTNMDALNIPVPVLDEDTGKVKHIIEDYNQIKDINFLIDTDLLLNIISNPDDFYRDMSNVVDINIHYKYFIEGDLIMINLNNNLSLNINLYHCDYFDAYLYFNNKIIKGET